MSILRKIAVALWKVWFYVLIFVMIIVLFPFLIIGILKESWYPLYFRCTQIWSRAIMLGMGFYPKVVRDEKFERSKSYMLVSNHSSMTDIMMMLHTAKNPFVFVGKAELAKLPLFGFFYKRTCILVDRKNPRSRKAVFDEAQRRLSQGMSICIFPEGGVPNDLSLVLDTFKDGAFRLAIDHQIPIVPITFHDNKKRFPYHFLKGGPGRMRARVHHFIPTVGLTQNDKRGLRDKTRDVILKELEKEHK